MISEPCLFDALQVNLCNHLCCASIIVINYTIFIKKKVCSKWHTIRRREAYSEWSEVVSRFQAICSSHRLSPALVTCFQMFLDGSRRKPPADPRPLSNWERQLCRYDQSFHWLPQDWGDRFPGRASALKWLSVALELINKAKSNHRFEQCTFWFVQYLILHNHTLNVDSNTFTAVLISNSGPTGVARFIRHLHIWYSLYSVIMTTNLLDRIVYLFCYC